MYFKIIPSLVFVFALIAVSAEAQSPPKDYRPEIAALSGPTMPPMGLEDADERVRAASRLLHSKDEAEKAKGFEALDALTRDPDIQTATDARMSLAAMTPDRGKSRALLDDCVQANPRAVHCLAWLGVYRRFGTGGAVDAPGSTEAFSKAAALGSPDAQWYYGMALYRGLGVKADEKGGYAWVEKSARQDHVSGLTSYGTMNALGQGTQVNKSQAYKAYARTAALGNIHGLYVVGLSLQSGDGVKKDLDLADTAILMAAMSGHPDAASSVRTLMSEIPEAERKPWLNRALARSEALRDLLNQVRVFE